MTLTSWLIVILPVVFVLFMAFYSRKYVRDVADYLACGRVAGRYVISVGDLTAGLSVITLVASVEQGYQAGMAVGFWGGITTPLWLFMALTGYVVYRFRETRSLSIGQFLEQRYSRRLRITAAIIRTFAEMVTNAIGPAVAVRFFIYFIGIPHKIPIFGFEVPTYGFLVALLLILALAIVWPAGRISLLITDCFQGIISYPIFVIFTVFVLLQIDWFTDVTPVMLDRAPGESFLNPMDVASLRDFNLFALVVSIVGGILNRGAWVGNDTTNSARNAHEQKMANILGTWRNGFAYTMVGLIGIFVIVFMMGGRFASKANEVRIELSKKISEEVIKDPTARTKVVDKLSALKPIPHKIGKDAPYSRTNNPDIQFFNTALAAMKENKDKIPNENAVFQEFKTLYNQMMMPMIFKHLFNPILMGLFTLLMVMLLLSTDDSRIFNASSTIIQDIILPLKKNPMSMEQHLWYLKICSLATALFFFVVSLFFAQLDYIVMFTTIMCAVWLGGAGPVMIGGLYTRFGTTFGAWCSIIFGCGLSFVGLIIQRNWPDYIYPWLDRMGYIPALSNFLVTASKPFHPYVVWEMSATKFPINSMEIYFMSMVLSIIMYLLGSLVTYKEPYNLDRLLHRGKYRDAESLPIEKGTWTWRGLYNKIVGITPEYTTGDKIIAWSVVIWSLCIGFGIFFCGVLLWNAFWPISPMGWSTLFYIGTIPMGLTVGCVSTVWFLIGGIKDSLRMFRDLEARIANPLDDGRVVGHVSLADKAHFDEIEGKNLQVGNSDLVQSDAEAS